MNQLLLRLAKEGCHPSIYRRGDLWRAHVNAAGNYWADRKTPQAALEAAVKLWIKAGKPMDGMACVVNEAKGTP